MPGADKEGLALQFSEGRTEHLSEMKNVEFAAMLVAMESIVNSDRGDFAKFDIWRKRVIAVIGAWLAGRNQPLPQPLPSREGDGLAVIKGIACRAAGVEDFNRIPLSKLRAIYAEWGNKNKVSVETRALMKEFSPLTP
jgi:hypothetical protein